MILAARGLSTDVVSRDAITVMGVPLGTDDGESLAVRAIFEHLCEGVIQPLFNRALADKFNWGSSLQCAFHVLRLCLIPRVMHILRNMHPDVIQRHVGTFDRAMGRLVLVYICGADPSSPLVDRSQEEDDPRLGQTWRRIILPSSLGGAGVTSLEAIAAPAYVGSWFLVSNTIAQLHPRIFHVSHTGDPALPLLGLHTLVRGMSDFFPEDEQPQIWGSFTRMPNPKMQFELSQKLYAKVHADMAETMEDLDLEYRAVWESGRTAEAARFLSTIPADPRLRMNNEEFKQALAAHVGLRLADIHPKLFLDAHGAPISACRVCGAADIASIELHALTCQKVAKPRQNKRHNDIRDLLAAHLRVHAATQVETQLLAYFDPDTSSTPASQERQVNHRADITMHSGDRMTHLVDVAVSCTELDCVGKNAGRAAGLAEKRKLNHYKSQYHLERTAVIPFSVEAFGRWGPEAEQAAKDWAAAGCSTREPHKDPKYSLALDHLHAGVSCILARHLGRYRAGFVAQFAMHLGLAPLQAAAPHGAATG